MRKSLLAVVLGVLGCFAMLGSALADQSVSITPGDGTQDDTFVLRGSGFVAGTQLVEVYVSPDGQQFSFYIDGVQAVIVVADDGTFSVSMLPRKDFQGAAAGTWGVAVCTVEDTPNCFATTINISL